MAWEEKGEVLNRKEFVTSTTRLPPFVFGAAAPTQFSFARAGRFKCGKARSMLVSVGTKVRRMVSFWVE